MYVVVDILFSKHSFDSFIHPLSHFKRWQIFIFCFMEHDVTTVSSLQILRNFNKFPAINIAPFIIILHFKWEHFQKKKLFYLRKSLTKGVQVQTEKRSSFLYWTSSDFCKRFTTTYRVINFFLIFLLLEVFPWLIGTLCLILCFPSPLGVH